MFGENYHMSRINQRTVGLKRQDLLALKYVLRAAGGLIHIMSNKDQAHIKSVGARFQLTSLTNMLTVTVRKSESNVRIQDRRLSHYKSVHGWGSEVRALFGTFASIGDRQHNYGPLAISTALSAALKRPVKVCTCSLRCSHVSRVLAIKIAQSLHLNR